jgi:hypothetical protein
MLTKPLFKSGDLVRTSQLTWVSSPHSPVMPESRVGVIANTRWPDRGGRAYDVLIDEGLYVIDEDMLYVYEQKL